jgi:hypothetical protein
MFVLLFGTSSTGITCTLYLVPETRSTRMNFSDIFLLPVPGSSSTLVEALRIKYLENSIGPSVKGRPELFITPE